MPVPVTPLTELPLVEIFSSIQGEGVLVGYRQVFLRLPQCNLDCRYCDTDFAPTEFCQVEDPPGSGTVHNLTNPVALSAVVPLIEKWCQQAPGAHHSISITGGEPLLHHELLRHWLPELRKLLPIYLETNGTLPGELETLIPHIDWVSMDVKLPSVSGLDIDRKTQLKFLQISHRTKCYVKLVVGKETTAEELTAAAQLVASVSESIPLILQPVTIDEQVGVSTRHLLAMQQRVAELHPTVRIIPQTHRYLGVM